MDAPAVFLVGGCSWQPWRPQEQTHKEGGTVGMTGQRPGRAQQRPLRRPGPEVLLFFLLWRLDEWVGVTSFFMQ
jgi:hypothetical protein